MIYNFEAHCDDDDERRDLSIMAPSFDEAVVMAFAELAEGDCPENNPSSWTLRLAYIRK